MIIVIDNYDSFVHNLARYVELAGHDTRVIRNDAMSVAEIKALNPTAIILSPGPCTPKEAGICIELVQTLGPQIPVLGVCLGHQVIGEAYDGETLRAAPCHGRASMIAHNGTGIFHDIQSPFEGGRYHSLVSAMAQESALEITARTDDGTIMAMAHKTHPVYGVQFHPESILTQNGLALIRNFVRIAEQSRPQTQERAA